jgi:hypothetical protein
MAHSPAPSRSGSIRTVELVLYVVRNKIVHVQLASFVLRGIIPVPDAQRIVSSTEDLALGNLLRDSLAIREQITGDLTKGDAAAPSEIRPLLSKLRTAKL